MGVGAKGRSISSPGGWLELGPAHKLSDLLPPTDTHSWSPGRTHTAASPRPCRDLCRNLPGNKGSKSCHRHMPNRQHAGQEDPAGRQHCVGMAGRLGSQLGGPQTGRLPDDDRCHPLPADANQV